MKEIEEALEERAAARRRGHGGQEYDFLLRLATVKILQEISTELTKLRKVFDDGYILVENRRG